MAVAGKETLTAERLNCGGKAFGTESAALGEVFAAAASAWVGVKNLWFYPDGSKKGAMSEKFREAWWVITGKK